MPTSRPPKKRASSAAADRDKRTVDRKSVPSATPLVRRDQATGRLLSAAGDAVILRGGHYHLFQSSSQCTRKLTAERRRQLITLDYGPCYPCAPDPAVGDAPLPDSRQVVWSGEEQTMPWDDLFTILTQNGINLLRVFLFNGFGIKDGETTDELYPLATESLLPPPPPGGPPGQPPKVRLFWRVKDAVESDVWNNAYFQRLRSFAETARDKNVFLQLSIFNYYELNDGGANPDPYANPWLQSIWNPQRCWPLDWGSQNLLTLPADMQTQAKRQLEFIAPSYSAGLRTTQEKIVRKVVKELQGLPNIILEVMNEPHQGTHQQSSMFSSAVAGWIVDESAKVSTARRPLISVNASLRDASLSGDCPEKPKKEEFDIDWWAAHKSTVNHYGDVDIVSFHALTGYPNVSRTIVCDCKSPLRHNRSVTPSFFPVALNDITARYKCFRKKHPTKAIVMSTDAVSVGEYNHVFGDYDMNLRDGQIVTGLGNAEGTPDVQRERSDLENWAYWCANAPKAVDNGVIHFQNHSTFEATYAAIGRAFSSSGR